MHLDIQTLFQIPIRKENNQMRSYQLRDSIQILPFVIQKDELTDITMLYTDLL